jgi:hypothetical protein|tara:strand:- start:47 stop:352 length:306 start_codon:yes stop_codon:yes gene_type:complete
MALITASIDVTKIDKTRLVAGKKLNADGKVGQYLNLTLIETPGNQYGDSHMVVQSVSKEEREQGVRGTILGNGKTFGEDRPAAHQPTSASVERVEDDDVPF